MIKSEMVAVGYDRMAKAYLANRDRLKSAKYVQQLLKYLPKKSLVLDLGCGAGVPVDDVLLKAGHSVIGIDISSEQIKLARKMVKGGDFLVGDIAMLVEKEYQVQAVVSLYTLFHLPRRQHLEIIKKMASFLPKDGLLLLTMGDREFEGEHTLYGTPVWSSQYGTAKNKQIIESAGFKILMSEIDNSGGERHQIFLAEKK
jgi:ubiquinone/menaquinone biosynthesis C-methylase UbiE